MPPGFSFPNRDAEIWVPLVLTADDRQDRNNNEFYAVARLKPGATLDSARAEMDVLAAQSRRQYPKENENTGVIAERPPRGVVGGRARHGSRVQRGRVLCAAHRLRQSRQPPAGARARPPSGAGPPLRPRRRARAARPPARHRERRPRGHGRRARRPARGRARADGVADGAGGPADLGHARRGSARPRLRGHPDRRHHARVWVGADAASAGADAHAGGLREGARTLGGRGGTSAARSSSAKSWPRSCCWSPRDCWYAPCGTSRARIPASVRRVS